MMEAFIVALVLALACLYGYNRLRGLQTESAKQSALIAALTRRVYELERASGVELPHLELRLEDAPRSESVAEPLPEVERPPAKDWEGIVGTSWLNRIGALFVVVGLALFLGYSLTHVGPAGKIAIGLVAGLSMLGSGTLLRSQERYRNFGVSLVGGGWAAIFFTCYAMYGIEASRVIQDPVTATLVLLSVSACMILHALLNRSEPATALAFTSAFVSLNLAPLNTFGVAAVVLLAFSMVFLAYGFVWPRLATAGVALTYFTFAARYDISVFGRPGVTNGLVTLWTYWLLFEIFDLLQLHRSGGKLHRPGQWLFSMNLVGFFLASVVHESSMRSADWSLLFGGAGAAYSVSSLLRARLAEPASKQSVWSAVSLGGYEGAASASAAFIAAAIIWRFSGLTIPVALIAEGEALILASYWQRRPFLGHVGTAVLILPFIHLLAVDSQSPDTIRLLGVTLKKWTPVAAATGLLFLLHRWVARLNLLYPHAAAILFAAVLFEEFNAQWLTVALGVEGMLFLAAGLFAADLSTRIAGLAVMIVCIGKLFFYDMRELGTFSRILSFLVLGIMLLAASWAYTRYRDKFRRIL